MSSMKGNPHYASAVECAKRFETTAEAQADATLALAFEQRTAALVAFYAAAVSIGARDKETLDLQARILERLGLK